MVLTKGEIRLRVELLFRVNAGFELSFFNEFLGVLKTIEEGLLCPLFE